MISGYDMPESYRIMCNWFTVRMFWILLLSILLEAGAKDDIRYVNMFGGEMITINFNKRTEDSDIVCDFGKRSVKAVVEDKNIRCLVPRLTAKGIIPLKIKKDSEVIRDSTLHVGLYGRSDAKKHLHLTYEWGKTEVKELIVTWNATVLSENTSAKVDIVLVGYQEHSLVLNEHSCRKRLEMMNNKEICVKNKCVNNLNGALYKLDSNLNCISHLQDRPTFKDLKILKGGLNNSMEKFKFNTANHRCSGEDCELFEIGMVEVRLRNLENANKYGYLTSYIKPLGWFFVDEMVKKYGKDWPSRKCDMWYEKDKQCSSWSEELLDCPCTLQQALTDFGRWQPDTSCNMFTGSVCKYHKGAIHCVRSFHPTKSGAGNQCCFSKDGIVRYAADSYNGSTPDRSHDWGGPVYDNAGFVPSLSHWVLDVVPLFYCCMWDNYRSCDKYMELRATRDCKNYEPPRSALIYGCHIVPFDNTRKDKKPFTLTEVSGDFWLIKSSDFLMQGRFTESLNSSALCGIAMKENSSSTVEVYYKSSVLEVFVDKEIKQMNTKDSGWQDLKGLTLIKNTIKQDNITVIMQSGVGVQIAIVSDRLHIIIAMPQELLPKLGNGLLHTSRKEGKINEKLYRVHTDQDNKLSQSQLCKRDLKKRKCPDPNVIPTQSVQMKVESCGLLDVPRSIKSNYNYSLGGKITIIGCRKGTLSGEKTYECVEGKDDNKWVPEVTAKCKANTIQLSVHFVLVTVLWLVLETVM